MRYISDNYPLTLRQYGPRAVILIIIFFIIISNAIIANRTTEGDSESSPKKYLRERPFTLSIIYNNVIVRENTIFLLTTVPALG